MMIEGHVLYNAEAEPGAADGPGVALVHPVKAFEYPLLVLRWDADACIPDAEADTARGLRIICPGLVRLLRRERGAPGT